MLADERVLLLGARGFVGRHVRAALEGLDGIALAAPGRDVVDVVLDPVERIRAAVTTTGARTVVLCVGALDGGRVQLVDVHTRATAALLDALSGTGVRLVRIGSAGEYGPVPTGTVISEDNPAAPVSAYGVSHLASTLLVSAASRSGAVEGVTLRVFNPVGPGSGPAGALGHAAAQMARSVGPSPSVVLGPLGSWRDIVDVRDVGAAVAATCRSTSWGRTVLNIGSGRAVQMREAVARLADAAGFVGTITEEAPASDRPDRSAGVGWTCADIRQAEEVLGWSPTRTLDDAVGSLWEDVRGSARTLAICVLAVGVLTGLTACAPRSSTPTPRPTVHTSTGWVYQLQGYRDGRLDSLVALRAPVAVIDLSRDGGAGWFTREEVGALRAAGSTTLAYLEIGSLEDFRPELPAVARTAPDLLLQRWDEWPDERFVRYWDPRWWDLVIRPRLDRVLAAGYDGVYLDTLLAYEEVRTDDADGMGREQLADAMVALVRRIASYLREHHRDALVVPQNSTELRRRPGFTAAIDGVGIEELWFRATDNPCTSSSCRQALEDVRALRASGRFVLAVDYARRPSHVAQACRRDDSEGFAGYVAPLALDRVGHPCPR